MNIYPMLAIEDPRVKGRFMWDVEQGKRLKNAVLQELENRMIENIQRERMMRQAVKETVDEMKRKYRMIG